MATESGTFIQINFTRPCLDLKLQPPELFTTVLSSELDLDCFTWSVDSFLVELVLNVLVSLLHPARV